MAKAGRRRRKARPAPALFAETFQKPRKATQAEQLAYLRRYREWQLRNVIATAERYLEDAGLSADVWVDQLGVGQQRPVKGESPSFAVSIGAEEHLTPTRAGADAQLVWWAAEAATFATAALEVWDDVELMEWWDTWTERLVAAVTGDPKARRELEEKAPRRGK